MRTAAPRFLGSTQIEARVVVSCLVQSVYRFYLDFRNLPAFLGDVMMVEQTGPATSRWTIQGPFGINTRWTVNVTASRANELIRYETVCGYLLNIYWELRFAPEPNGRTQVREIVTIPFGKAGLFALRLLGKSPAAEVSANLHRLKQLLETGLVTDPSQAVRESSFAKGEKPPLLMSRETEGPL